jgi:hypothetical protein
LALHLMVDNFVRVDQTLRCTGAMKAGVTDRVWGIAEVVGQVQAQEVAALAAGPN